MARFVAWKSGWFDYRRKRFWAWVLLALYALIGFVVAPLIVRHVIVDQVQHQLGLTATLADVDINPFALSARLSAFSIADRGGEPLVAFDEFDVNLQLSSIINRALTLREVRFVHPFANLVRHADGALNLAALVPPPDPAAPHKADSPPLRMIIGTAAIERGRVAVTDRAARQPYRTEFGPVDLTMTDLSTLPDREGSQTLVMQTLFGGRLEWSGQLALEPLHSSGHIALSGERLPELSAYFPEALKLNIVDGTLGVAFDYSFAQRADGIAADVSNLTIALKELGLARREGAQTTGDLLRVAEFAVAGGRIAWPQRTAAFERVVLSQPQISLARDVQQQLNWLTLWQPEAVSAANPAPAPATAAPAVERPPWSLAVARFEVADGGIAFDDQGVAPAASLGITGFAASLDGLTLADAAVMPFALQFNVDGGGAVALDGTVTARPVVHIDAKAKIDALALNLVNPYLRADTYLQLASGALSVDGHLVSNPAETFGFDGSLQLVDLEVQREGEEQRFAGLKRLDLKGITASAARRKLDIARAELAAPFAKIHISKDRVLNLSNVVRTADAAPAAPANGAPWGIALARLKIVDGDTDFTDESLPIPFHRDISKLTGGIDALDSLSSAPTRLALTGHVGEYGELRLSGHLRALDPLLDTDITAAFKNVEMPGASPYVIRFAGHKVASGKLDLDLHYVLKKGIIDGQHKIVLRDFELGEKVDSPEALDLPYGLAISLLKDADGKIDVDLPIEGDVNDPEFRIGGVIVKALVNLLTKIVTAPFTLLGRLVGFGGSEGFDQIYFQPGSADLSPPEREKIAKIAEALMLRPNLALTLHGVSEPAADARAIQTTALRARLDTRVGEVDSAGRVKVVEAMAAESIPGVDLAALRVQFALPDNPASLDETAYVDAVVAQLIDAEPLPADAVATLAAGRAAAVHAGLIENPSMAASRLTEADSQQVELAKDGSVPMKLELAVSK